MKIPKPPKGTEAEKMAWEDKADQALVLIQESLESHSGVIKECETPVAAFQAMYDLYSGATNEDATRLETKWVNEKPNGDAFMEYIAVMSQLRDKLSQIGVTRTEKDLILRMMGALGSYPEGHPFEGNLEVD